MRNRSSKLSGQQGIYMVMMAGMLLALITIVALFFASSFLSANKTRLQNSANFAALGAIERYVRAMPAAGDPPLSYNERADIARNQANALLDRQALIGATHSGSGSVGALGYVGQSATGGTMEVGVWYSTVSSAPPHPCGTGPCFEPASPQPGAANPNPLPAVNAVRLKVVTPHPFGVPLLSLLGFDNLEIASEAIAAVVPRCTVYVLDTSESSQKESHPHSNLDFYPVTVERPTAGSPPSTETFACSGTDYYLYGRPFSYSCPRESMPFAFNQDNLLAAGGGTIDPAAYWPAPCGGPHSIPPLALHPLYTTTEGQLWCNLEWYDGFRRRLGGGLNYPFPPPDGMPQLPDFYRAMNSPKGPVVVDTLNKPQPLANFLLGFNAGTRMMISQSSQSDKAGFLSFKGQVEYRFPQSGLSTDLGFIALVTNADRINPGWVGPPSATNFVPNPPESPNFIDIGLFARMQDSTGSNIVGALDQAISLLAVPNACPVNAQKSIILATDGVMNCTYDSLGPSWGCGNTYTNYLNSESYLLTSGFQTGQAQDSILRRMQASEIAFSVLVAGATGPNIVNRFVTDPAEPNGGHFVNVEEARALGMTSMPPLQNPGAVPNLFVDSRSDDLPTGANSVYDECLNDATIGPELNAISTQEERMSACAFYKLGRPGVFFRRPLAALYKLATETGGWYCPFMQQAGSAAYSGSTPDSQLTHAYRTSLGTNTRISVNPFNRNAGQEAAVCAQQTLGLNPFLLVREGN